MFTFITFYRHIIFLIDCTHFTHAAFCIRKFKKNPVRIITRSCCSFVCLFVVVVVVVVVVVYRPVSSESSLTFHTYCGTARTLCLAFMVKLVTFIPAAELLAALKLSLPVSATQVCRGRDSNSGLLYVKQKLYQ